MLKQKPKNIEEVLTEGVKQILPTKKGLKSLMRKRKIRIYLGVDPTSPDIHIGNAVCLRKLKEFQNLGHEVIFLIGNFTAQIGDPSERGKERKPLTLDKIRENMAFYKEQAAKIVNISKIKIKYNADWLAKFKFKDLINLASHFTVSRLLERDMFQKRLKKGEEVWLNELFYPLMQGYDSVAMNVDLEIGGTDQTFNMLMGRKLQRIYNKKDKFILTMPLLIGLDGRKMSKSYNNVVNLTDKPNEMYGKIMSLKDNLILHYFELCFGLPLSEIKKIEKDLRLKKINPRDLKAKLAKKIVGTYYGIKKAKKAEQEFNRVFKEKKLPLEIKGVKIKEKELNILELLLKTKKVTSKAEAKRLILQKAIKIDNFIKEDWREVVKIKKGSVIKIGKKKFIRIT